MDTREQDLATDNAVVQAEMDVLKQDSRYKLRQYYDQFREFIAWKNLMAMGPMVMTLVVITLVVIFFCLLALLIYIIISPIRIKLKIILACLGVWLVYKGQNFYLGDI